MVYSFDHFLGRTGAGVLKDGDKQDGDKVCRYLEELAYHAYAVYPGFPAPVRPDMRGELELYEYAGGTDSDSGVGAGSLSFEADLCQ